MKAIRVEQTGGPEVLRLTDLPDPGAGPGEVVVAAEAIGVNFIDVYQRTGLYPKELPFTPGMEAAGTIVATGPSVTAFTVGDRVASAEFAGAYAESAVGRVDRIVPIPESVPGDIAAAVMLQGMTAHYLSHDTYPLAPGATCLIHAGAGGVGLLLIQMAKMRGATVVTTVSTAAKEALARDAGADHVIRYTEVDFAAASRELLGDHPFDVVYDSVGRTTFLSGLDLLRTRGVMVLFGQSSGPVAPFDLQLLNAKGSLFVTRPTLFHYIATPEELRERANTVLGWVASGALQVKIGRAFPLAEAGAAHRALAGRETSGKVLLLP